MCLRDKLAIITPFSATIRKDFFELIDENSDVEDLVIVTHGGVISIVRHILNNMEWSNKNKGMGIKKTSITKLIKDDEATRDIPVIIFSSLVNEDMARKGQALGADAQLTKPEIGMLVDAIDRLIAQSGI